MAKKTEALTDVVKKFGNKIKKASDIEDPVRVPTGLFVLDDAIGGGIPTGAATTLCGKYGSTKSALCYRIAGNAVEQLNKPCLLIHTEGAFENVKPWAIACGLPIEHTFIMEEPILEDALDGAWEWLRSGEFGCIIIDSLGGLMPRESAAKVSDSESFSSKAKGINKFYRGIAANMPQSEKPLILVTNHFYNVPTRYGSAEKMPGGEVQGYIASLIIKLMSIETGEETLKTDTGQMDAVTWMNIKWFIDKNKFGPSKVAGSYRIYTMNAELPMGTMSEAPQALIMGLQCGAIKRSGAWYYYNENKYHGEAQLLKNINIQDIVQKYCDARGIALDALRGDAYAEQGDEGGEDISEEA